MSFLDSIFSREVTQTIDIEILAQTFVNGVIGPEEWTKSTDFEGLFWRGSMADRYVSEKYRADVAGVVVARPEDVTAIVEGARLKIEGLYYSVIYMDDIAEQGEVSQIPVRKWIG